MHSCTRMVTMEEVRSPLAALVCAYVVLVLGGRMEPELNEDR